MLSIILSGACGRMGQMVQQSALAAGIPIAFGIDLNASTVGSFPVYRSFGECPPPPENSVIIDFSLPAVLDDLTQYALRYHCPAVLAATGYDESQIALVNEVSRSIPVFRSGNMSLGICVLRRAVKLVSDILPDYDIEIIEKHHNQKKDAPSGTALSLYETLKKDDSIAAMNRSESNRPRQKNEIGISSIRGGTVYGEHEVGFYGPDETLLLTHRAQSRKIFADGALKAAEFILKQPSGLYSMDDMVSAMF